MILDMVKTKAFLYRSALVAQKYSPELLIGIGIGGILGSTVLACKATLKVDAVMAKHHSNMDAIQEARIICRDSYSEEDANKDLIVNTVQTGASLVRLYAPAAILGLVSISCILTSHSIVTKRNLALMAAYKVVDESFKQYRQRVADEFGPEKEDLIRHNTKQTVTTETTTDEEGKKVKTKVITNTLDRSSLSEYSRCFDEYSREYMKTADLNLFFLVTKQNWANDLLNLRGHLFLNEVYDILGMPRSQAGAVVGWVKGKDAIGDQKVDFGIYAPANGAFINGYEKSIWLDFNVDGVIWDKI